MEAVKRPQGITLINPFDAHIHWRVRATLMSNVAKYSIRQFSGGLLMPNTRIPDISPHVVTMDNLMWYRKEVEQTIMESGVDFFPIFTFYLCPELNPFELVSAWESKIVHGVKYYPKGGTTNSESGVAGFHEVRRILEVMEKYGIPLLIHGETPKHNGKVVDDFEREAVFMETELVQLVKDFPGLKIVLEHITTGVAADFAFSHKNVHATITPQHCLLDRRALYNGTVINGRTYEFDLNQNGSNPSMVCRPLLKHEREVLLIQKALRHQAANELKILGLGSDSAAHISEKKYCEGGACGVYSAPIALELYAMSFEQIGILDHLPVFACDIMPEFYGIKDQLPKRTVSLEPVDLSVEMEYDGIRTPFAGQTIPWTAAMV